METKLRRIGTDFRTGTITLAQMIRRLQKSLLELLWVQETTLSIQKNGLLSRGI